MEFSPLMDERFSKTLLQQTYDSHIRHATAVGRDGLQARNLDDAFLERMFDKVVQRVHDGSYRFTPYRQVLKLKGATKLPRQVAIPTVIDRLVMRAMVDILREFLGTPPQARAQDIVRAIRSDLRSGDFSDFIRLDLVNFYPSIPHSTISRILHDRQVSPQFVNLVLNASSQPVFADGKGSSSAKARDRGVPAGLSLANTIGELVLHDVDTTMRQTDDVRYYRFVDDILILAKHGRRVSERVRVTTEIETLGLRVHKRGNSDKFASGKIVSNSIRYLGYTFSRGVVTVEAERTAKLISSLARSVTMLRHSIRQFGSSDKALTEKMQARAQWWFDLSISGCISNGRRRGWLAYYSQLDDLSRLKMLDNVASNLILRLPPAAQFESKSFQRTYTLVRDPKRDRDGYILDFDNMTYTEKRKTLRIASSLQKIPRERIALDRAFHRFIGLAISALETDVGSPS